MRRGLKAGFTSVMFLWGGLVFAAGAPISAPFPENETKPPQIILNDVFFQPTIRSIEGGKGGMDPLQWTLGAKTNFASWVDVKASVGSSQLLYRPTWTQNQNLGSVAPIDIVGTLHTLLGDFYAGQTLVPWGLEGQTMESQLWLPRTLFFENGVFPLRDLGVGLYTEVEGTYMNLMVHNGEGGGTGDQDNRMFFTAQWGHKGSANSNYGFGFTAGRVAPPLVTYETHLRGGNIFFGFNIFGLGLQVEGYYLQSISNPQTIDTFEGHGDLEIPVNDHVNLIGRYEQFNPNTRATSNIQTRIYAGGEYHSLNNISRLFLFAVGNYDTITPPPGNEIRLMWRISPLAEY